MGLPALKEENLLSTVATSSAFLEIRGSTNPAAAAACATSVLRDINLTLAEGEFVAIVGFSGSGRDDAHQLIAAFSRPMPERYCSKGACPGSRSRSRRRLPELLADALDDRAPERGTGRGSDFSRSFRRRAPRPGRQVH